MKNKFLVIIIVILIVIIVGLLTYEKSETLAFKENDNHGLTYNFGVLEKKDSITINFNLNYINKSYNSLEIYGVIDACDCTNSSTISGKYFLGDTIPLKVNYNPNLYKDSGFIEKQVLLLTNKSTTKFDTLIPINIKGIVK